MFNKNLNLIVISVIATLSNITPANVAAQDYKAILLPFDGNSGATALSNNGLITGWTQSRSTYIGNAVTWNASTAPLVIGDSKTIGKAVNDAGQAAGVTYSGYTTVHATLWQDGIAYDLGANGYNSNALAINASGQVVGWSGEDFRCCNMATLWDTANSQQRRLSEVESEARAINTSGQVAGWRFANESMRATLWTGTQTIALGEPQDHSAANGINDIGQVVGTNWNQQLNRLDAVLWSGIDTTYLTPLSHMKTSIAADINNKGLIVGNSANESNRQHAVLWIGSEVIDLNSYLDPQLIAEGWSLTQATAINDDGWIIGHAEQVKNGSSIYRGFLLSPVPEPSSLVMILIGGVIIFWRMRAKVASHVNHLQA